MDMQKGGWRGQAGSQVGGLADRETVFVRVCMCVCATDGRTDGQTDERDGQDGQNRQTDGWKNGQPDRQEDRWGGRMDERVAGPGETMVGTFGFSIVTFRRLRNPPGPTFQHSTH